MTYAQKLAGLEPYRRLMKKELKRKVSVHEKPEKPLQSNAMAV